MYGFIPDRGLATAFTHQLSGGALARGTKGSGDKRFPVLDSRTSGLHVCSRDVSIYCMRESWRFFTSAQDFEFIQKSHLPEPFFSRAKAPPAERSEKGHGDENRTTHTQWASSELPFASVSKRVYMRNHSYENEFNLHVHFHANQSHFHLNGFARRLVLKQRQRVTRKWPI